MGILYFLAFVLLCFGLKINKYSFFDDNVSLAQANALKGFFILLVFISHCLIMIDHAGYSFSSSFDKVANYIQTEFGQLIVAMFLFYSGYGVTESLAHKGLSYLRSFPKRRILTTLLNFDVAVILYIIVNHFLGIHFSFRHIIYSFFAWKSVGNIEWYIFAILFCYSAFYLSALLFSSSKNRLALSVLFLTFAYALAISLKKQHWWYDTIFCFPTGVLFSLYYEQLVSVFKKHYYLFLLFVFSGFIVLHCWRSPNLHGITYNLQSVFFSFLVVLLTMKCKTGNFIINWLGANLFPIYIYQCIPMIVLSNVAQETFLVNHPHYSIILCLILTLCFAWGYKFWRIKLS